MTCEEFQIVSLDLSSQGEDGALQQAAREHLHDCSQCAAFQGSWLDLSTDLHAISGENLAAMTPPRVEMRLRQEFRNQNKTWKPLRTVQIAAWGLAAAAVLVGTLAWMDWRHERDVQVQHVLTASTQPGSSSQGSTTGIAPAGPELGEVLVAANSSDEFTLLPGNMPGFLGDATVVHVQMQRAALSALGLTVNEEHAGDWIQVDLLLGDDGQPQAVRLPASAD